MRRFRNEKEKESYLNDMYNDSISSEDDAVEQFIYLANKNRGDHTTERHIRECYRRAKLGSLLKRLDPIAFNAIQ